MLQGLTYRKKNKLLLVAGALLLLLTYALSIRRTIAIYREAAALQVQFDLSSETPAKIVQLEKQLSEVDHVLTSESRAGNVRQVLLGVVTGYCSSENVILREFPGAVYQEKKDFAIETNVFTIEGSFAKLLRLVYLLEHEQKIGKASSVKFFIKKDIRTGATALVATVYLKNIKRIGHE